MHVFQGTIDASTYMYCNKLQFLVQTNVYGLINRELYKLKTSHKLSK